MAQAKVKKNNGTMNFIVIVALLTLVGAGTGFAVGALLRAEPGAEAHATAPDTVAEATETETGHAKEKNSQTPESAAEEEPVEAIDPRGVKAVPFPPVLTTLAEPVGAWIRLEGSILVATDTEDAPELLAEKAGEQILTYLRSVRLTQIEGPAGVLGLRGDLNETVKALSNGQVRGVLIHGLVVE